MSSGPLIQSPQKSLNKAFRKQKPQKNEVIQFKENLQRLINELNENESEEHIKNDVKKFLEDSGYKGHFEINTKDRTDLVIHTGKSSKDPAGVLMEVKRPGNRSEMISKENLNAKALQELVLYYLRERVEDPENRDIKHLVVTNVYEWFIFDSSVFYNAFFKHRKLKKSFLEWSRNQLEDSSTTYFYNHIAGPVIDELKDTLEYTYFDLRDYQKGLKEDAGIKKLIPLFKILSPTHLLKREFSTDSNNLDRKFYHELLHIIGLEEVKEKSKKLIRRKEEPDEGSLLENTLNILTAEGLVRQVPEASNYGENREERIYNVSLELCISWINRILFLKLLEGQLLKYHKEDRSFRFLDFGNIPNYDELNKLFFQVLAQMPRDRNVSIQKKYSKVPYLNSSLFEPNQLEQYTLRISNLDNSLSISVYKSTVLQDENGKRKKGELNTLQYLFEFLDAYDFSSEGSEEVQEENKTLINASVLGLIFEKINGYKDGSFFTPGFITMYMCRETIRRAVVQKFNEQKDWKCEKFDDLYNQIKDIEEANTIINRLKICDPAVGSGHFLVSALNEIIAIKSELGILSDREGKVLRDYSIEVVNDELIVSIDHETIFEYQTGSKESQRVQEALFHEKETIIENCLFGVDINTNSVKICRLRLWIELLKSAYYTTDSNYKELETLPNIDINIKQGNSLISRFSLDEDLSKALKSIKYNIDDYRSFVNSYKNATDKEEKRGFETLINQIKADFRTEIHKRDPKVLKKNKLGGELFNLLNQVKAFEPTEKEKKEREKKKDKLETQINKLSVEIEEIKNNKIYRDAFEWRFEFPEVLDEEGKFLGFDVVIGNPPYIRQEELSQFKIYFSDHYKKTYAGTADLYVYFIELGIGLLKFNGNFTFIIPNKWMRAGYGKNLRRFIKSHRIHRIQDFGDLPVFEEATTYPLIIELSPGSSHGEFQALNHTTLEWEVPLREYVESNNIEVLTTELSDNGWTLTDSTVQKLLAKIRSKGIPLGEYVNGKIFYGIKTGLNEAFVIERKTRDKLLEEDPRSDEIIKPFLAGRDIKRYQQPKSDRYLIFTRRGIEINDYPAILRYLEQFKERLEPKPTDFKGKKWLGRKPGSYKWYEIQDAVDYYEEFDKKKIIVPAIVKSGSYAFDEMKYCSNDKTTIIPTTDLGLLGILNSSTVDFYLKNIASTKQNGYFEYKPVYLSQLPIIKSTSQISKLVSSILIYRNKQKNNDTSDLESQINQLVYELYGLTEEEVKIVEGEY